MMCNQSNLKPVSNGYYIIIILFLTFCTPLYTCQLWSRHTARGLRKLYVAYNNAFRMMHHLPTYCSTSEMFTINRVPYCAAVIGNLTFRFMSRLILLSNALVVQLLTVI